MNPLQLLVGASLPPMLALPGNANTFGHGTTAQARFWKAQVVELMRTTVRK